MNAITIAGGGLAGLTLGIALRQRQVPVTILEAGRYPRHRVCGEFICGKGLAALDRLQVAELARPGAVRPARDVAFFGRSNCAGQYPLRANAICISRYLLDYTLAIRFQELGGELRTGERWSQPAAPGVIFATGRRAQTADLEWRWFGLKVHAHSVSLRADLEMHVDRNAYVGLCRLPGGEVNVCGLFRRRVGQSTAAGSSLDWLRGAAGSELNRRLGNARFNHESFCAVAGLSFRPQNLGARDCRVGDALTMIPPLTGNGMSIAFESAALAADALEAYARNRKTWESALREIAALFRGQFAARLAWAARLHGVIFSPAAQPVLGLLVRLPFVWRACFMLTR